MVRAESAPPWLTVADSDTVFLSGDRELLTAATRLGLAVARIG